MKMKLALLSESSLKHLQAHWRRSSKKFYSKDGKPAEPVKGTPYNKLTIGVPKEVFKNEKRVALTPAATAALHKAGFNIVVEENAGLEAKFLNDQYAASGATVTDRQKALSSDIVLKVRAPSADEISGLSNRANLISFLYPAQNKELIDQLAKKDLTVFAMDAIPRVSRAQVFDALSSMANIAGYKAVIEAANNFGRFFTGMNQYPYTR